MNFVTIQSWTLKNSSFSVDMLQSRAWNKFKTKRKDQHFLTEILGSWSGQDLFRSLSLVTHDIEISYNREINLFACYFNRVANVSLTIFMRNIPSRPSLEKLSLMTWSERGETSWRLCGFATYFITSFISLHEIRDFI